MIPPRPKRSRPASPTRLGAGHQASKHLPVDGADLELEDLHVAGEKTVTGSAGRIHVARGGALVLIGVARGGVVITSGGYARIAGHTEGLFVAVGGYAVLTGTCHGAAVNDGGRLRIEGTVDGPLLDYAGQTTVNPEASVAQATIVPMGHKTVPWSSVAVRGGRSHPSHPDGWT